MLLLAAGAGALHAQGPRSASTLPALPPAAPVPGTGQDTLPCPECNPPKQFWRAAGFLMVSQLVPYIFNSAVRGEVWSDVGPTTWRNNIVYPWQWDDNTFQNNQFGHPYQGNMYFNSARTNGYDFWSSAIWPFAGSLMWEIFFEAWAPAPNDFVNTSVGGVTLGETLYRLSRLPLDNTATGGERVWREVASGLLNPISGVNRLLRGETGRVSANPAGMAPQRHLTASSTSGTARRPAPSARATWRPAPPSGTRPSTSRTAIAVKDLSRAPFSYFAFRADLAGPSETGIMSQFSARGSLAAWALGESRRHQAALSLAYDYFNNPAFVYGGQSVQMGLVSTYGAPGSTWWGQTNFLFNGVLLGATQSDYYDTIEGRNYDYGPGLGTILSARFLYKNRLLATAGLHRTLDSHHRRHRVLALPGRALRSRAATG